ncbi:MAG: hypothetical protein B6I38_03580 [Anaerolineaceae bacterium 4572_5.1]|nr:MAG: hypothetical protein B6I38_03580 [Anaerolineaceae bacterium 4572_5.1]
MFNASGGFLLYTEAMHIILADHRPKIRFALCALLEQQPEFSIISQAASASELVTVAKTACPDLFILDWELQEENVASLVSGLRQLCPHGTVIILGSRPEWGEAALNAGADAFISKGDSPEKLLALIKLTMEETCRKQNQA